MFPFKEQKLTDSIVLREFSPETESDEFVWHRDREDRTIEIVESDDWWFQFDNKVPKSLKETLFIKAKVWHRVIKGPNAKKPLVVKIHKHLDRNG